jgi:hypothetical protein
MSRGVCPIGPYYPIGQTGCDPEAGWHEPSCPTEKGRQVSNGSPPRRPRESDTDYAQRINRWRIWKEQEPLTDLFLATDTEAAEYRAWAGTRAHHDRTVRELIQMTKETNP